MGKVADDVQNTVKKIGLTEKLGAKDENAGGRIKDIADQAGYVVCIVSIAFGVLIRGRIDDLSGFLIGFLTMCLGIFVAYLLVTILYCYGDMVSNTIEQTRLLKKLEAKKILEPMPPRPEETPAQPATVNGAAPQAATMTEPETKGEVRAEETKNTSAELAGTAGITGLPLHGAVDIRARGVAHFSERSRHGVICPLCGRLQDSNRDKFLRLQIPV